MLVVAFIDQSRRLNLDGRPVLSSVRTLGSVLTEGLCSCPAADDADIPDPISRWMEQCFTSLPTQYRLYGRRFFYRSKDPTSSIIVQKGHIQYINNRKNTLSAQ